MFNTRNKILLVILLILTIVLFIGGANPVVPQSKSKKDLPDIQVKKLDPRAKILADYLETRHSPLQYHAQDFIDAADTYGVDWKLVPAISGVESTFGKNSYGYNAWGWGIDGNQALGFNSWRHGIFTVTEGLRKNYIDHGLTNPYSINRVYATSPTWADRVNFFMRDLEVFSRKYPTHVQINNQVTKDAASSAELALKRSN